MPRRRKAGPPTQPVKVPTGMPYGQGQQMQESMAAMPLGAAPDISAMTPGGGAAPPGGGGAPGAGLVPAAVAAAGAMPAAGPGLLTEPVANPGPLTAGLPIGPGPGGEVLAGLSRADLFQELARSTGDPRFLRLAQTARLTR